MSNFDDWKDLAVDLEDVGFQIRPSSRLRGLVDIETAIRKRVKEVSNETDN